MKRNFLTILTLILVCGLLACNKDPQIITSQSENVAKSSYYDNNDDEDDEDEEDEDYEQCCSFKYGEWTTCTDGYQIRSWTTRTQSCVPPLDSIQRTCQSPIVQYFYYNSAYNSLRVACNSAGPIHIYNPVGQLTAIVQYQPVNCTTCARWVSVAFLPTGTYKATFYTRTITFNR